METEIHTPIVSCSILQQTSYLNTCNSSRSIKTRYNNTECSGTLLSVEDVTTQPTCKDITTGFKYSFVSSCNVPNVTVPVISIAPKVSTTPKVSEIPRSSPKVSDAVATVSKKPIASNSPNI